MKDQDTLYTGQLTYKEIEFTFVFDRKELRLIPPKDKKQEIEEQWLGTQIAPGLYTPNIPVMEDSHLSGICNESGRKIVFLTKRGSYIATHGNHLLGYSFVLSIKVIAYVVFKYDRSTIDRISFANSEINAIHPVNKSFTFSLGTDFEEFAANKLYLRHIPESYDSGRHKDAAKFIMLTSAFEWEFRRTYPNGVQKSEKTLAIEKTATEAIELLFKNSSGKLRDKYRYLKKRIKDDPLQSEIEQIGTDFAEIIDLFGKRLYSLNDEKLVYTEMGKRLGDQRNHFAHGDLDKDFIDLSLLDLIFLERIVYAIQLRYYAIETPKIQNAINDLFHCGFALSQV